MFSDFYKGKRVLVTGDTGFKGSWMCAWLHELGAKVHGISIDPPSELNHFDELGLAEKISHTHLDIKDEDSLVAKIREINPEVVFHLAAKSIVRYCYENPLEAYKVNVLGSLNVLTAIAALENLKSAVMITSDKCYENVEWEFGYREDDQLGGIDPYSSSKACAEIAFHSFYRSYLAAKEVRIGTARAGNVIGGGDWARDRIVPDAIRAWNKGESLEVRSPNATRPWQHVLEPLSGYLLLAKELAENAELAGESFNFGPGSDVNKTVDQLLIELNSNLETLNKNNTEAPIGKKEAGLLKLCCDKAIFHLDWSPVLTFGETAAYTSGWYKDFYNSEMKTWDVTLEQIRQYQSQAQERGLVWTK